MSATMWQRSAQDLQTAQQREGELHEALQRTEMANSLATQQREQRLRYVQQEMEVEVVVSRARAEESYQRETLLRNEAGQAVLNEVRSVKLSLLNEKKRAGSRGSCISRRA